MKIEKDMNGKYIMYNHTITLYNGWIPLSDLVSLEDYTKIGIIPIPKEQSDQKLGIDDLMAIERYEKECFVQMLKLFAKENNLQKVELETDIRESTLKQFMAKNSKFREKWKCDIQQRFHIREIPETDAVVSILLIGNIQDISFLYDFPCESNITLHNREKCIMYLCYEWPSEISYICKEKNVGDNYLEVLKVYQKKIIERIDKRQTNEIIYAVETMEIE
ncbi:MAG: hypothetical protein HDT30_07930 [Clostridiales bacterium]|nr:hypothetical protein [Clostridiales bacterium]